jgi:hypothetical protein
LPAHPRHSLAREHRAIEQAISLGNFKIAHEAVMKLIEQDSTNFRSVQLFAEVQRATNNPQPIRDFLRKHPNLLNSFPPLVLTQLADVLTMAANPSPDDILFARRLYLDASKGRFAEREVSQVALGLSRAGEDTAALHFIDSQIVEHPDLRENPWILRLRGNALIGLAKKCSQTGKNRALPYQTKSRAWNDCRRYIEQAEQDLRHAMSLTGDALLVEQIEGHLAFIKELKRIAAPPSQRFNRAADRKKK